MTARLRGAIAASVTPLKDGGRTLDTMAFEGQGGAAGHGKGTASVRLEPTGPDDTLLHYAVTASVKDKPLTIGLGGLYGWEKTIRPIAGQTDFHPKLADHFKTPPPLQQWNLHKNSAI